MYIKHFPSVNNDIFLHRLSVLTAENYIMFYPKKQENNLKILSLFCFHIIRCNRSLQQKKY